MKRPSPFPVLRLLSLALFALALAMLVFQLIYFSRAWANYPPGMRIANIPVGLLDRQSAAQRLLEVYSLPVELYYDQAVIQLDPAIVSFQLDLDSMLGAAELERTRTPFWQGFWDYLWGRTSEPVDIPLRINYSEERLRIYLRDIVATRYDQPARAAVPKSGTVEFQPGTQGTTIDIERALPLVENALRSSSQRVVSLPLTRTNPGRPSFLNLEILLKQTILDVYGFDGTVGLYLSDLQSGQQIYFLYNSGSLVNTPPDLAFTASSTIKIPIMVTAFRYLAEEGSPPPANSDIPQVPLTPEVMENIGKMTDDSSDNIASDWVMRNVLDVGRGPLIVSEQMQALGLSNTFLAGYFAPGSPLLFRYRTTGNQRTDVQISRDDYSQTTPAEIGMLLEDIYYCVKNNGGTLRALYPEEISAAECQLMLNFMLNNKMPLLLSGGLPDGTQLAHKHGWVSDNFGVIRDMSDSGIVFTQGGDYVLSIFLYHPTQLVFDPSNALFVALSQAVYNYYNLPQP